MKEAERIAYQNIRKRKERAEADAACIRAQLAEDDVLETLRREQHQLLSEIGRLGAYGKDFSTPQRKLDENLAKRAKRLAERGLTEADLLPKYVCPLCKDTGSIRRTPCMCYKKELLRVMRLLSGVAETDVADPAHISLDAVQQERRAAYSQFYNFLSAYANSYRQNPCKVLGVLGAVGTGKTYALTVLANAILASGGSVVMLSAQRLNQLFLDYHLAKLEEKPAVLASLFDCDFLFIDDLGTEPVLQNVTLPYLYMLFSERLAQTTAFTSNYNLEQLEDKYGQRVFSRIIDKTRSALFLLEGDDLRQR